MPTNIPKLESVAVLTLKDIAAMTPEGRRDIAEWLRRQARLLEHDGSQYGPRFRARYLYTPEE